MKRLATFLLAALVPWAVAGFDLRENTASQRWCFQLIDSATNNSRLVSQTLAVGDLQLFKLGAANSVDVSVAPVERPAASGEYCVDFGVADTDVPGGMKAFTVASGATPLEYNLNVMSQVAYDAKYATDRVYATTIFETGTATAAAANSITLAAATREQNPVTSWAVVIDGGACDGQTRSIIGYVDGTNVATVDPWATTATCTTAVLGSANYVLVRDPPGTRLRTSNDLQDDVRQVVETDNHLNRFFKDDYDPVSKPGNVGGWANAMVENSGGNPRYTVDALSQAPSGGGSSPWTAADVDGARYRLSLDGTKVAPAAHAPANFQVTAQVVGDKTDYALSTAGEESLLNNDLANNTTPNSLGNYIRLERQNVQAPKAILTITSVTSTTRFTGTLADFEGNAITSKNGKYVQSEIKFLSGLELGDERNITASTWSAPNITIDIGRALTANPQIGDTAVIF